MLVVSAWPVPSLFHDIFALSTKHCGEGSIPGLEEGFPQRRRLFHKTRATARREAVEIALEALWKGLAQNRCALDVGS
jgi:hypothetical protein